MTSAERAPSDNERRVREIAARQHGVFSRAQAREAGVGGAAVSRRVAAGLWCRVLPGVYAISGTPVAELQLVMAATLWAGPGAVVSHGTAGQLWKIDGARAAKVELWVPSGNRTHDLVVVHRGTRIDRADRAHLGPIRVTSPLRTLIDLAGRLEDGRLVAAMESVFRQGLGEPDRLAARLAALRGSGRPGAGRLGELLAERGDGRVLESVLEATMWRLLCRWEVPRPKRQHWVALPGGRYRLDFAWPEQLLGLECDGWEHHGARSAFDPDRARLAEFAAAKWRILPVTWAACTRAAAALERRIRSALSTAA